MSDFIKRERANFGRDSRLDVSSGERFALRQNEQIGNALFEVGKAIAANDANNKNAAWQTYLQTRTIKLKAEVGPALQNQSDFAGIDAQMAEFERWDTAKREEIMGGKANVQKYLDMNKQSTLLTEQTALMANAAKLNLTNAQASTYTSDLIKATAQNFALTKDKNTQAEIDAGFYKSLEETQTYSANGLVMRARTSQEINKIFEDYKTLRDNKVKEHDYLTALNMALKQPYALSKTILEQNQWQNLDNGQRKELYGITQRQIETRNGTFAKAQVQKFNDFYARIAEVSPVMAKDLLNDMLKNPGSRETTAELSKLLGNDGAKQFVDGIKGLDKNDFDKVINGWETIAGSPDIEMGVRQLSAIGQIEVENRNLGYRSKDGDIELMDKAASEAIDTDGLLTKLENIQNNYTALTNRKLKSSANKVIENFKSHLGASIKKDAAYVEERGFFMGALLPRTSRGDKLYGDADEYIKDVLITNYPGLTDAETGEAYYRFRRNAEKNGFPINDNSTATKAVALKLLNNVLQQNMAVKYNAPASAQNIIDSGMVMPANIDGKNTAGQAQSAKKRVDFQIIDGYERMVEYAENGSIVNIYDAERY